MTEQGLTAVQIEEQLGKTWRTKERLKDLVPSLAGRRLIIDDQPLWDRFCWAYDDIRNKLIHAARDLDHHKTERAMTACRDVSPMARRDRLTGRPCCARPRRGPEQPESRSVGE
jgi:hypothetical protein